jgi:lysophospholipase L1-like esterase
LSNPDPDRVTIVEGDVLDLPTLEAAMKGQDVVYANVSGAMKQQAECIVEAMHATGLKRGRTSMKRIVAVLSSLVLLAAVGPATAADEGTKSAPPAAVRLRDRETIVFYGDSITEQNLYTAYLETFLLSRFPSKDLAVFNLGWSGDTASGAAKRFARDVAPVQPSLVFVNFGMNDGGYKAYDEATYRNYLAAQGALADIVRAAGSRQVLFTTSPVDDVLRKDQGVYNGTLSRMAHGLGQLAAERKLPLIDLLHPMLDVQRRAKEKDPGFT